MKPSPDQQERRLDQLVTYIDEYIGRNDMAPTMREMNLGTGFHHTTIERYLTFLSAQERIVYFPGKPRAISIRRDARPQS